MEQRSLPRMHPTKFEDLIPGILRKIRKNLMHDERLELRKATKLWHKLPQGYVQITDKSYHKYLKRDQRMPELAFISVKLDADIFTLRDLPLVTDHLRKLAIHETKITTRQVKSIIRCYPKLTDLYIQRYFHEEQVFNLPIERFFTDISIRAIYRKNGFSITQLKFHGGYGDYILKTLNACASSLRVIHFHIYSFHPENEGLLDVMPRLRQIKELKFTSFEEVSQDFFIRHLPQSVPLETVELHESHTKVLRTLFAKWGKKLNKISFMLRNDDMSYFRLLGQNLRELTISEIGDKLPLLLANNLEPNVKLNLQKFVIIHRAVDEDTLADLLFDMPNLRKLDISPYPQHPKVKIQTVSSIFAHQVKLRELCLWAEFYQCNNTELMKIVNLRELEKLEMFAQIPDVAVDTLANKILQMPELRYFKGYSDIANSIRQKAINRPFLKIETIRKHL